MSYVSNALALSGRRNRVSYALVTVVLFTAAIVCLYGFSISTIQLDLGEEIRAPLTVVSLVALGIVLASTWLTTAQRFRDIGWSGWWILSMMLPYVGILIGLALYVWPGTDGDNKYGAKV